MWDRIIDNLIAGTSNRRLKLPGVSNVTDAQLNEVGWYERMYLDAPEGHTATAYQWEGVIDGRSVYSVSASEPTPEPVPDRFPHGIDAPILVLDAQASNAGAAFAATDDGDLVYVGQFRSSPYKSEDERRAMTDAAVAAHNAGKGARETVRLDVAARAAQAEAGANGAGNSMPLLRAEVARIAAALKTLTEGGL